MHLVYSTLDVYDKAHQLAIDLIEEKLAACVNVIENKASVYRWKGGIVIEKEYVLLAKTKDSLTRPAMEFIKQKHPYDLPCILSIPCVANSEYEQWIDSVTQ